MNPSEAVSFVVRVVLDRRGQVSEVIDQVAAGLKEASRTV